MAEEKPPSGRPPRRPETSPDQASQYWSEDPNERFDRLSAWLTEKWGSHHPCPHCDNKEWGLNGDPLTLGLHGTTQTLPVYAARCTNCGHLVLIGAATVGMFPPDGSGTGG